MDVLIAAATLSRRKEPLEIADLINWADRLKLQAEKSGKSKISVAFPEDEELDVIRKVFECRLAGSMVTVQLVVNDKRKISHRAANDAITIDGGASYADILKSVKAGVDLEDIGVHVKKIHKTQAGAMRLSVVETTPGGRQMLLQKIEDALPKEANIRVAVQTKGIIITDIEEDVAADEVKSALAAEVGVESGSIRLSQFRMSMRGTKSATVFLPTVAAENAIKMRRMKLGWTSCLIRERIDPPLCGKCQAYGHRTGACSQRENAKRRCFKCGDENHMVKECPNQECCFTCGGEHRANSMRCAKFRDLVGRMKTSNNA